MTGIAAEGRLHGFADQIPGQTGAFSALSGNAKGLAQLANSVSARVNRIFDLMVGNAFADAYVHAAISGLIKIQTHRNANENLCQ